MERQKILNVIAYYLSEFDMRAFQALGYSTRMAGLDAIAPLFGKNSNYLKRLRDEYDVVTSSTRRGQCNRPPRAKIKSTRDQLSKFSFQELTEIVRAFIENAQGPTERDEAENDNPLSYEISEGELERILNFEDATATIKIRAGNSKVRVYSTAIIKQLKTLYSGQCQICGAKPFPALGVDICEAHHIDYFSASQNNDSGNIVILCPNHHRLIHKLNPTYDASTGNFVFENGNLLSIKLDRHLLD
jgi:predicted HNH restriction endonuclease